MQCYFSRKATCGSLIRPRHVYHTVWAIITKYRLRVVVRRGVLVEFSRIGTPWEAGTSGPVGLVEAIVSGVRLVATHAKLLQIVLLRVEQL